MRCPAAGTAYFSASGDNERRRTSRCTWTGATSSHVDIYRDSVPLTTAPNDASLYTDITGQKSGATYLYQVCEAGSTALCSGIVVVTF